MQPEVVDQYDVVIVGGGLVGASLVVALAPLNLRVALIEASTPPQTGPSWDERCIAINDGSHRIFESLGVWPALLSEASPITSTHISERGRFGVARFAAVDVGLPALGYNIPFRHIGQTLWQAAQKTAARLICPARLQAMEQSADAVQLLLDSGEKISTRLVVAADGAQSAVRKLLGITAQTQDYKQSAIVTAIRVTRPHGGVAYERFTPGGPIAVLPKPDNACSLVWTVPSDHVEAMLAWSDAEFLKQAYETFGERLGNFKEIGRRNAYPLTQVMSAQLTAPRVIFAGNAAQSLHPVAAQGFNLGLRDVATVADVLATAADPGSAETLAEYERRRSDDRERVSGFTDRLVRTFSNRVPGLRGLRHLGLLALDLTPPLKDAVMRQNLGLGGLPSKFARE
ncbi:2-octaprenyl-6-methoxyphenyl hydroxylase [Stenotrophobium rhamnosiphilum]|uniref:2-octaprenyl-6-methoxyphenyl hydroxylase n=1 Tax=Stenotrophobium rhamnosiphilum TaxID=2029166 RepID=A0A2T5MKX8_9GAMM|nr:2-octaprenyl-6-methoxyphenyl hydroxylase [Stenotrophobium rhamnosiphilum]PTU33225.1 2-octaprenyl-6-methoxyphenyl hydroxylase [Stenotrophobium rhamnosiphilum]